MIQEKEGEEGIWARGDSKNKGKEVGQIMVTWRNSSSLVLAGVQSKQGVGRNGAA